MEEVILQYGTVVSYDQLVDLIPYKEDAAKRRFVNQLTQTGWLVRIKKGLYQVVTDVSALGTLTLPNYVIAQLLHPGSYVSFESALQFHGLHDQLMRSTTSVALKQHTTVMLQSYEYRYVKTTEQYFYGFEEHIIRQHTARVATIEKSLIDMVQFHRSTYSTDRVLEILSEHQSDIDQQRLIDHLLRANLTTQRLFGLLFDHLDIAYDQRLLESAKSSIATSRVEADAQKYNAKWQLYYDVNMFRHTNSSQFV